MQGRAFERLSGLALAAGVLALVAYIAGVILVINSPDFEADSYLIDFTAFWGAAKLALAGDAIAAFDAQTLDSVQGARDLSRSDAMAWHYPPGMHILVAPLGLLPFSVAWVVFDVVSILLFVWAVRPISAAVPGGMTLLLCAPAVLLTLALGQNSLLSAACLTAALRALADDRTRRAGLLIALLTLKPSLGVIIPPALAAMRQWQAILWAGVGALVLAAVPAALLGIDYWLRFFESLEELPALMAADLRPHERMITWYGFARASGAGHDPALIAQAVASVLTMAAVALTWARPAVPFDLKAAMLLLGLPLATPYAFHYELVFPLVGIVFLMRFRDAWPAPVWGLILAIWLAPAAGLPSGSPVPVTVLAPPLLSLALLLCLREASRPLAAQRAHGSP